VTVGDVLGAVRTRWLVFALCCILPVAAAIVVARASTPVYSRTAELFVAASGASSTQDAYQGALFAQHQAPSYDQLVTSPAVLSAVIADLHLTMSSSQLAERVSAATPANSVLIDVTARNGSAVVARDIANGVAVQLAGAAERLSASGSRTESQVELTLVKPAALAASPASSHAKTDLVLGLIVGLAVAFSVVIMRERVDRRVRTAAQAQTSSGCRLVAEVGEARGTVALRRRARMETDSLAAESFRRLRVRLGPAIAAHRPSSLAVASMVPGDPGAAIAVNLALALAEGGSTIALVDADLRSPQIADYFGMDGSVGVTTVVSGSTPLEFAIQLWDERLLVLPAGAARLARATGALGATGPASGLATPQAVSPADLSELLGLLERKADHVVVHVGPVLAHVGAAELCGAVHAAVLTVRRDKARQEEVRLAAEMLTSANADLVSIVLAMTRVAPMTSAFPALGPTRRTMPAANRQGMPATNRQGMPASNMHAFPASGADNFAAGADGVLGPPFHPVKATKERDQ
jgi:succinoglycan biosynthesis transport protein ExoP